MAWSTMQQAKERPKPEMYFRLGVAAEVRWLKVGVYGLPETGKSHVSLTFPDPIFVVDTELGMSKILHHFADKKIYIAEVLAIDELSDQPDPLKSIQLVEEAVAAIPEEARTIVIDSTSDVWNWITAWLEQVATRRTATGQPYRFEYGQANRRWRNLILRLLHRPAHVVLTAREREVYSTDGKPIPGVTRPQWQQDTEHWCDLVFHMQKRLDPISKKMKYESTLTKCRFQRGYDASVEDLSFEKIVKLLDGLGVKLKEVK